MGLINYTGRDFTARFEALLAEFRRLCPELTDMNHSNAGIALIRLLGSESDFLSFYIDHIFSENFVDHAQFRQNLIRIGKASDILPKLCSASRTFVTISRLEGVEGAIFSPKWTRFSRTDGYGYLTDTDVAIAADVESVSVGVTQGEPVDLEVASNEFRVEDFSKRLRCNVGPEVAAYTCTVKNADNGEIWTEVESFYRSFDGDTHYLLELHADAVDRVSDTVYLTLNRKYGATDLPEKFNVTFIRTAGAQGNTGAGTITVSPAELEYIVSVTNPISATGGGGVESAEQLRIRIPAATAIQRRALTRTDYVALISGISGVRYCEAYDRNDDERWPHMYVTLYVAPEGGGRMSDDLRERIWLKCAEKGHLGAWKKRYILQDMDQTAFDIDARVGLDDGYDADTVFTRIRLALQERYNLLSATSVKVIRFGELHSLISSVVGVSWVEFDSPVEDIRAGNGSILVLGSITLRQGR